MQLRDYQATIEIPYSAKRYSIHYHSSEQLDYQGGRINLYNRWVMNFSSSIQQQLSAEAFEDTTDGGQIRRNQNEDSRMLSITLDPENAIVVLEPQGTLSEEDFRRVRAAVDPFIELHGGLNGMIIHVHSFPGWDSLSAMISHLTFIQDHHRKIKRIAVTSDSNLGNVAETLGSHLVAAEIKSFGFDQLADAQRWILDT
ncbi:MAG: STAS/SEC14 domain-containing protein [Pseudomonas neustonica]